ncbi:subtilase-type serine protease [Bradyrhizobium sp. LB9.1b]
MMLSKATAMLALTTCLSSIAFAAQAFETYNIKDGAGNAFMELRFFGVNDGAYLPESPASTWSLQPAQIDEVLDAVRYWGQIIKVVPGQHPAIINIGTNDRRNASAVSPPSVNEKGSETLVEAAITNHQIGKLYNGAHGFITVSKMGWAPAPFTPSQLNLPPQIGTTMVMIHEIAHTLGVYSPAEGFFSTLTAWDLHLRDENGKVAAAGQYIWCKVCLAPAAGADAFDARNDQAYFTGKHVNAVLAGAMPGIRVRTGSDFRDSDRPFFSHMELKNGLMSHQAYRNYPVLMEAELAALQDLGYTIDRRNLFGHSVYNEGLTLINDHPFFARNAAGTDYVANTFNMATFGLGLHVYGSNNTMYQRADLLSGGAGGGGIRVDGARNDLTILPGTRVYADGANGRGVMFAYGKDHAFTQRGDVEALGKDGIAVSFDFGHNGMSDASEYRGSYFVGSTKKNLQKDFPDYYTGAWGEVSGPLVGTFDLSGRVAGRNAAIYMSESGYVGRINVMQGAKIDGDITSNYAQEDDKSHLRITNLTFGSKADSNGKSSGIADPEFRFAYDGNIAGNNLSLHIDGGATQFTGNHRLYDVAVVQSATLSGKGIYQINAAQQFRNAGIVNPSVPGAVITINGNYIQSESGALQLAFNDQKAISSLTVNGNADLRGSIAFAPVRGWYQNGFSITSDKWLDAAKVHGAFEKVTTSLASPTLTAKATKIDNNLHEVELSRAANAYAQYGNSANSRAVGDVLYRTTDNARRGSPNLIAALDFSAADGSAIRVALPQLSAESYASAIGVLVNDSAASRTAVNNRLQYAFGGSPAGSASLLGGAPVAQTTAASATASDTAAPHQVSKDDLNPAWAEQFGSWSSQSGDGNAARTRSKLGGFISGIDAAVYDNSRVGVMASYSRSDFETVERGSSGSSENYTVGGYAGTEWALSRSAIGLHTGLAYTWHNIEMARSIAFSGFNDKLSANYNAGTFQAFGELGYKLNLGPLSGLELDANLAYVHARTDGFDEKGLNGAALSVQPGSMDSTLSTLGLRGSTAFNLWGYAATALADFGWRHAYGDVTPTSKASFAMGLVALTSAGSAIGRDTAVVETGFDVHLNQDTTFGLAYQGQFGAGVPRNGVNANLHVKF